ncbi:hypothetical protein ABT005_20185, partial [Pseudonocardia alni]
PAGRPGGAPDPGTTGPGDGPPAGTSRLRRLGIAVVALFALIGVGSVFGGGGDPGPDDPGAAAAPAPAAAPAATRAGAHPDDLAACRRAGEVMGDWTPVAEGIATGTTDLPELASATRRATEGMSEVPPMADDARIAAAARDLTAQYERIAAAASRGDLSRLATLAGDGSTMVDELVAACRAAG